MGCVPVLCPGSPPRTRGARQALEAGGRDHGITPAYAGSTGNAQSRGRPSRDHPRVRGEHVTDETVGGATGGSPPRTRRARAHRPRPGRHIGITPAYAGSTGRQGLPRRPPQDHPRVRGEHGVRERERGGPCGSPPRTRGAPGLRCRHLRRPRITPAYAGSTPRTGRR